MGLHHSNSVLSATVIICTAERPHELLGCLEAVAELRYSQWEVLVVENGPPDGQTRELARQHGARYLNSPIPGLSRARNDGARACRTKLLAYLDDDARPHPDWLAALAREFEDPRVMAVGGEILPRSGDRNRECYLFVNSALRRRLIVDRDTPHWFTYTNFGGIGDGCNMAIRRSAFQRWPGFDERLGRGGLLDSAEEHFAFFQFVHNGYRCIHTPEAIVWHRSPQNHTEWSNYNLNNMTNAVAYAALIWNEFPECRRMLFEHLRQRSSAPRRRDRASSGVPQLSLVQKVRVLIAGLRLYRSLPEPADARLPVTGTRPGVENEGLASPVGSSHNSHS